MADISKIQIENTVYDVKDVTARNGLNIIPQYIRNVKEYGAVGDGVTDDTTAIQNAINDNIFNSIYFPNGTYLISSPLKTFVDNSKQTNIIMEKNCIIKTNTSIECLFELGGLGGNNNGVNERARVFSGGILDGNNCNYGIKINSEAMGITIENCEIKNFTYYGIYIPSGQTLYSSDLLIKDCYINGKGSHLSNVGIYTERPDNNFKNLRINACKTGIYASYGGQYIDNVHVLGIGEGSWFNDTIFLDMEGGSGNTIINSYCDTMQTFVKNYSSSNPEAFTLINSYYYSYLSNVDTKLFIINNAGANYIIKNNIFVLPTPSTKNQGIIYNNFSQQYTLKSNQFILEDNIIQNSTQLVNGDLLLTTHKRYKPFWSNLSNNLPTDKWVKIGYIIPNSYCWYNLDININGVQFNPQFKFERFGTASYITYAGGYKNTAQSLKLGVKYENNTNGIEVSGLYIKATGTLVENIEVKQTNENVPFMQLSTNLIDPTFEDITMDNDATL